MKRGWEHLQWMFDSSEMLRAQLSWDPKIVIQKERKWDWWIERLHHWMENSLDMEPLKWVSLKVASRV